MVKKFRLFWLMVVVLLALAQPGLPALTAVGPVVPDTDGDPLTAPWAPAFNPAAPSGFNGFPQWYRDSLGQTLVLAPQDPLTIWDPVILGNPFSEQVQFGGEAMYWTGDATIPTPAGTADLIMALECAFNTGDAAPGEQIVFARIRIRIDTDIAGTYTVYHPYGTNSFTVAAADVGNRAINSTVDIGIGAPGDFTGALAGNIGPFLKQVTPAPPAGYIGDGTFGEVTGSPIPSALHPSGFQNFFRVEGPTGFDPIQTNLIAVTGKFFNGTPFNVTRSTYNRSATGVFADVFATVPLPVPTGTAIRVRRPDQAPTAGVLMTRSQNMYYGRIEYPAGLPATNPTVVCTATSPGTTPTVQENPLVDGITIAKAEATLVAGPPARYILNIAAFSTDSNAALMVSGPGTPKVAMTPPPGPFAPWTLRATVAIPPTTIKVESTTGKGVQSNVMVVLP